MSLLRERRRCPLKSWGPSGGNDFWGNPQEGVIVFPNLGAVYLIEGVWVRTHLFGAFLDLALTFSKTELRAAQPNFHRRRSRRLKVAARSLSVARRPRLK